MRESPALPMSSSGATLRPLLLHTENETGRLKRISPITK